MGNRVVIGRLWTIWKPSSTRHHSMSWGQPKCASIRRPSCASCTTCASVSAGCSCRAGSIASSCVPPPGEAWMASCLAATVSGDHLAVAHLVDVGVHETGDQRLAEAEARLDGDDLPVGRDRVGREQDAGGLRDDHLLHDHGHVHRPVVDAVPQAVGHGPLGEQRGPAPADVLEDRRRPHDVQVRVVLAGEGGRRQVLRRRAGSNGVGGVLAEPGERAGDRRRHIVGDRRSLRRSGGSPR